jgi:uncharacterized protein YlxW (UPF0749 family)
MPPTDDEVLEAWKHLSEEDRDSALQAAALERLQRKANDLRAELKGLLYDAFYDAEVIGDTTFLQRVAGGARLQRMREISAELKRLRGS